MNYNDVDELAAAIRAAGGSWAALSRDTGVSATTLKDAAKRLGVYDLAARCRAGVDGTTPDEVAEVQKQNDLLRLENRRLRQTADRAAKGELEEERILQRIEATARASAPSWEAVRLPHDAPGDRSSQELVLPWSDLHAAEEVSLEETRGINEYDWSIMEQRMEDTQRAVFSHADHFGFNVSKLHIPMLGDMLSGDIHEELAITNDRPLAEAVVDLAYTHVPWLLGFAERFPKIVISGVPGNHPRRTKKPSAKLAHDNADWLFYHFLAALLKGHPQFEFDIARGSFNVIKIAERWRALLMHGDGIRSTMPGVPWGGVVRRITTLEAQFTQARQPLDFVFLGHFHTRNALDGVGAQTFMNGSVKGADEYSLKAFGSGRPASQSLLSFHEKRGWTGSYAINLQGSRPASEGWGEA